MVCVGDEAVSDLLLPFCLGSGSGVGGSWRSGSLLAGSVGALGLEPACGFSTFVLAAGFSSRLGSSAVFLPTAASMGVATAAGVAGTVSMACSGTTSSMSLLVLRDSCSSETTLWISWITSASTSWLRLKLSLRSLSLILVLGLTVCIFSTATKLLLILERGRSTFWLAVLELPDTDRSRESGDRCAEVSNMARRFLTPALLFRWSSAMAGVAGTKYPRRAAGGERGGGPRLGFRLMLKRVCDDIKFGASPLPYIDRSNGHTVMTDRRMRSPHTSRHSSRKKKDTKHGLDSKANACYTPAKPPLAVEPRAKFGVQTMVLVHPTLQCLILVPHCTS